MLRFILYTRGDCLGTICTTSCRHTYSPLHRPSLRLCGEVCGKTDCRRVVGKHYRPIYGRAMALLSKYASYLCSVGIQSANLL